MSKAPREIIAMATREGAYWKVLPPSPWFGEAFDSTPYILKSEYDKLEAELFQAKTVLQIIADDNQPGIAAEYAAWWLDGVRAVKALGSSEE